MKNIKTACVFCGSSNLVENIYREATKDLAKILVNNNIVTVYGGGNTGLMADLANTCVANNGEIIGIIPKFLKEREVLHPDLSKVYIEKDMHSRKMKMFNLSDIFICLPGGLGTLDEFIEILAWKQLGIHNKRVILVNINNYWSDFLNLFEEMGNKKFTYSNKDNLFNVIDKAEEIVSIVNLKSNIA